MSSDNSVATATLKVLASGDVDGRFAAFLKRLEAVEKKAGQIITLITIIYYIDIDIIIRRGPSRWSSASKGRRHGCPERNVGQWEEGFVAWQLIR